VGDDSSRPSDAVEPERRGLVGGVSGCERTMMRLNDTAKLKMLEIQLERYRIQTRPIEQQIAACKRRLAKREEIQTHLRKFDPKYRQAALVAFKQNKQ
jgi:hypothetical protein